MPAGDDEICKECSPGTFHCCIEFCCQVFYIETVDFKVGDFPLPLSSAPFASELTDGLIEPGGGVCGADRPSRHRSYVITVCVEDVNQAVYVII